jgi:hypothetical protein
MGLGRLPSPSLGRLASSHGLGHAGNLVPGQAEGRGPQHWPRLSFNDLVTAFAHLLPRRPLTAEDLADIIAKQHRLRRQASDSHARQSMKALE